MRCHCICLMLCNRKAKRCYQKAFELDRQSPEAGKCLVHILMALDEKVPITKNSNRHITNDDTNTKNGMTRWHDW